MEYFDEFCKSGQEYSGKPPIISHGDKYIAIPLIIPDHIAPQVAKWLRRHPKFHRSVILPEYDGLGVA